MENISSGSFRSIRATCILRSPRYISQGSRRISGTGIRHDNIQLRSTGHHNCRLDCHTFGSGTLAKTHSQLSRKRQRKMNILIMDENKRVPPDVLKALLALAKESKPKGIHFRFYGAIAKRLRLVK
jgi:hypothetical protein